MSTYSDTIVFSLTNNYRSCSDIIRSERRLISHNPDRMEVLYGLSKDMKTAFNEDDREKGSAVQHLSFHSKVEEEEGIANKIEELLSGEDGEPTIAILVRNNSEIPKISKKLMQKEIPVNFSGVSYLVAVPVQSTRIRYDEPEINLLMTFLSTIIYPSNSKHVYNLIISPAYSFPPSDLAKLTEIHIRNKTPLRDILKQVSGSSALHNPDGNVITLSEDATKISKMVTSDLDDFEKMAVSSTTSELVYHFLKRSGLLDYYRKPSNPVAEAQSQNIARFLKLIESTESDLQTTKPAFLIPHLQTLVEQSDITASETETFGKGVHISTIHKSKNMEFDYVFLVGATEDRYPGYFRREWKFEIPPELSGLYEVTREDFVNEERKLVYVSLGRAKKGFFFTTSSDSSRPSRYIFEAMGTAVTNSPFFGLSQKKKLDEIEETSEEDVETVPAKELLSLGQALLQPLKLVVKKDFDKLSFQQLDCFLTCPLQFCYENRLNLLLPQANPSVRGKMIFHAISDLLARKRIPSTDELNQAVDNLWKAYPHCSPWLTQRHTEVVDEEGKNHTKSTVQSYVNKNSGDILNHTSKILESFVVKFDTIELSGTWDRIDNPSSPTLRQSRTSFEKGRKIPKKPRKDKENFELLFHVWAYHKLFGTLPSKAQLDTMDSEGNMGTVAEYQDPNLNDLKKVEQVITSSLATIRAGTFQATPSFKSCTSCNFKHVCPSTYTKLSKGRPSTTPSTTTPSTTTPSTTTPPTSGKSPPPQQSSADTPIDFID